MLFSLVDTREQVSSLLIFNYINKVRKLTDFRSILDRSVVVTSVWNEKKYRTNMALIIVFRYCDCQLGGDFRYCDCQVGGDFRYCDCQVGGDFRSSELGLAAFVRLVFALKNLLGLISILSCNCHSNFSSWYMFFKYWLITCQTEKLTEVIARWIWTNHNIVCFYSLKLFCSLRAFKITPRYLRISLKKTL